MFRAHVGDHEGGMKNELEMGLEPDLPFSQPLCGPRYPEGNEVKTVMGGYAPLLGEGLGDTGRDRGRQQANMTD